MDGPQSREIASQLFDANPLPMWAFDRKSRRFLEVNAAAVRHYGYTRDEFLAMTVDDLVARSGQGRRSGDPRTLDGRFHARKDGSVIEVELRSDMVLLNGIEAVVTVVTDVTERRRSERALGSQNLVLGLLASGEPLHSVLGALAETLDRQHHGVRSAIFIADEQSGRLALGAAPNLPTDFLEVMTCSPADDSHACCGPVLSTRDRIIVEDVAKEERWSEPRVAELAQRAKIRACWCQPILSGDGAILGTLAMYSEVARPPRNAEIKTLESAAYIAGIAIERTRSEQTLRARERMLRLQMEQMPVACIVQDRAGRVIQWNPAAEHIFGWNAHEALTKNAVDLIVPKEARDQVRKILQHASEVKAASSSRNVNVTKDGREIICEWQNSAILDEAGRTIGTVSMAQDVTERLASEQALRRSEQLNRRIIEHMPGGLVQVAMDGAIVQANGTALEHLGFTYDEITHRFAKDFESETIDEAGNPLPAEEYPASRCIRSGKPEGPVTIGVRRRDGRTAWGVYQAIPLHRPDGEQDGALITFLDITDRRAFEEALRESEERFRFAQASSNAGTFDWDPSDRVVWSESAYTLFGVQPGTPVTSSSWLQMIDPADRDRIIAEIQAITARRQTQFRMEYRIQHPQNGLRWIASLGRCVFDDAGQTQRVAGIHIDITQLKKAQLALARSEERYRRLAEHGAMGIWEVSPETRETLFANPAICGMLEISSPDELKGTDYRSFFTPESLKIMEREHARRLMGEPSMYEVEIIGRRGGRRRVIITGAPVTDAQGKCESLIGTFTDITDRKAAEDALRRAQKLDAVGRLASGVAHDFQNLLTAIFGFTSLARRTLSANHPATKALDRVDEAARQASGVTKALLTFTRQDSSEKKPMQLGEIVEEAVRLLRRTLPADIQLRTSLPSSPVWVYADRTQLHQVIMNLAINARDAMAGGGKLTIAVDTVNANLAASGNESVARLTVTDTGCGMTPAVLGRIFEPFFTTKPEGEGTGLGLPIIHGIVQNHDGKIEIESTPDSGTTFRILLPLTDAAEESATDPSIPIARGRGELILLADSHGYTREIMSSMLVAMGYEVAQASDRPAVIDKAGGSQGRPRLLILDAGLCGASAEDLVRTLRTRGISAPVILMSATPQDPATWGDPSTVFLRKPFQMTELASAVAQALHTSSTKAR